MKLKICFLLLCATFYVGAFKKCPEGILDGILQTPPAEGILRSVLKILLDRFDDMDRKLLELQHEVNEHREELERNRVTSEKSFSDLLWAIHRQEQDVGRNMSVLQDRSLLILDQQTSCANHDRLREKLFDHIPKQNLSSHKTLEQVLLSFKSGIADCVMPKPPTPHLDSTIPIETPTATTTANITSENSTTSTTEPTVTKPPNYTSCKDVPANVSGEYLIRVNNASSPFKVYCEMEKFGGGWIVMQHRFNGSVDFYRNWDQYRDGFGELDSEFWLGLERIHQITAARAHEIVIEMKDFEGNYGYARYNAFQVGSESEQYIIKTLGSYSGTAGDSMTNYNKGAKFSTKDRDNDGYSGVHYAMQCQGAWWYSSNSYSNLNGMYEIDYGPKPIFWVGFKNDNRGMRFTRMMIREL